MNGGTEGTGQNYSSFRSGPAADRATWVVGMLNELCEYLQQIGIGATVVWDDPSPEAIHYQMMLGTFGEIELPLGYVKVEGRSIV